MPDALITFLNKSLPENLVELLKPQIRQLENAEFEAVLRLPIVQKLLGHVDDDKTKGTLQKDFPVWVDYLFHRIGQILGNRQPPEYGKAEDDPLYPQCQLLFAGIAAVGAFLQSNVTGPVLPFSSAKLLFLPDVSSHQHRVTELRKSLVEYLGEDGEAAYHLTPNVELLALADVIMTCPPIMKNFSAATWARLRVNFLHQRLLSDVAESLQKSIYEELEEVETLLLNEDDTEVFTSFLLERATVHLHHGFEKEAKDDLIRAAKERNFEFALTGLLGKRTKYQQKDVSQLVILAKSADENSNVAQVASFEDSMESRAVAARPEVVGLDDDTILDSISFAKSSTSEIQESDSIPLSLTTLDPSSQPMLQPLDSIILLQTASTITNTNPADGLTREETLPYATRVLEGGSSNWQVYTQALLLRSRIEGYKSRTVERGLLQLQALVDQIIADTVAPRSTPSGDDGSGHPLPGDLESSPNPTSPSPSTTLQQPSSSSRDAETQTASSFLPKPKDEESAPAAQRLEYIYQLCTPYRWSLEAELANRWISLGGLRSALEIYNRLEMWPEAALCYAATDNESEAIRLVRKQLFHSTNRVQEWDIDEDTETWEGAEREPPPQEAPRLWCILGDVTGSPAHYEKAWEVSSHRYARAMRSLGRYYWSAKDFAKASLSYSKALKVKPIDHATWFALGCCLLEREEFKRAVEAFSRAVQIDPDDAEAWSNLAAALLHLDPSESISEEPVGETMAGTSPLSDEEQEEPLNGKVQDPQKYVKDALRALKQAARLKPTEYRIWSNLLMVSASLDPPSYPDILAAQSQIIALRGSTEGESCIDLKTLTLLAEHVIAENEAYDPSKPGLPRMVVKMLDEKVVPLITGRSELWHLISKVYLWRGKPSKALEAEEKSWRVVTQRPGWENGKEEDWEAVVNETERLVNAYRDFGQMEKTEGMAAGSGELVEKQWRFKARSAIRGIMGKGKASWEDTKGWERLQELLEGLK